MNATHLIRSGTARRTIDLRGRQQHSGSIQLHLVMNENQVLIETTDSHLPGRWMLTTPAYGEDLFPSMPAFRELDGRPGVRVDQSCRAE